MKVGPGNVTARHYLMSEGHRVSDERGDDAASMETNSVVGRVIMIRLLRVRLMAVK